MNNKLIKKLMAMSLSLIFLAACGNGQENKTDQEASTEDKSKTQEINDNSQEAGSEKDIITSIDKETEIVFWHAMSGGQGEALDKLIAQFEEKNPNIKINAQNQSSYGDLSQKLTATMQSPDDLPTITQAYGDWIVPFKSEGLIVDLKAYIEDEEIGFEDYQDILPGLREEIEEDGQIISLPFNKSTEVFWYNKTLFDELGLEVPKTFEELKEVSEKIYQEKQIPGVGFDSLSNFYASYLKDKGLDMNSKLDVNSKESKEAISYYHDGIKEGYMRIAGTDQYMSTPFSNEQVAAYIGSNAGEVYIKDGVNDKFEYRAAPYPASQSIQQGTNIYMFSNASPEQRRAAYEFLKFLTSKDAQIQFALETGYMPIRQSAIDDKSYSSSQSAIAPILSAATANLYYRQVEPGSQQAYNDTAAFLEQILSNTEADLDSELEIFKATYESAYQQ